MHPGSLAFGTNVGCDDCSILQLPGYQVDNAISPDPDVLLTLWLLLCHPYLTQLMWIWQHCLQLASYSIYCSPATSNTT